MTCSTQTLPGFSPERASLAWAYLEHRVVFLFRVFEGFHEVLFEDAGVLGQLGRPLGQAPVDRVVEALHQSPFAFFCRVIELLVD